MSMVWTQLVHTTALADTRLIPLVGAGASGLVLLVQAALKLRAARASKDNRPPTDDAAQGEGRASTRLITRTRGRVILASEVLRLLSCIALLGLSITTARIRSHGLSETDVLSWWANLAQCETYTYATVLAFIGVFAPRYDAVVSGHLSFVLLVTWAVYIYRDVVPLATNTLSPADAQEGILLWIKLSVLTIAAVIIPSVAPHCGPSLDDEEAGGVAQEHAAGWFSQRTFSWLDETIAKAHKVDHIPLDDLPPLAKEDRTGVLVKDSLKYLDPLETRRDTHLAWGFLKIYRTEYAVAALLALIYSVAGLSWPLATQGLLSYLEVGHAPSVFKPWAWLLFLFFGPSLGTICEEWYQWTMVGIEPPVLLLFQHALRIRIKSETSSDEGADTSGGTAATVAPKSDFLVGKLNNLITTDLANVTEGNKQWLILLIQSPVQIVIAIAFMYSVLGWSALVGLGTLVAMLPLPGYLNSRIQSYQGRMMEKTDARVQLISEVLNVIRMIKLFGWEKRVAAQVEERRKAELKYLSRSRWLEILNNLFNYSIPLITMATTFVCYTVVMKQDLTASKLFSSNAAFILIQMQMYTVFGALPVLTQARVSLDRINGFLHETELLDEFEMSKDNSNILPAHVPYAPRDVLGIKQMTFTWTKDTEIRTPASGTTSRRFVLNIDGELLFKRGRTNLIVGPTGSGKTSLLMALLGEMHARPSGPEAFVSLPRVGGVAYAAQESWVLSDTIRNNILFGAPFDEARYAKVLRQCALERDLSLFDAGDKTEVGERGITLSGGQKARITLARAVYSSAETLLLDDVLAALDVHTGRWIVDQCFNGDLLRGRTVLLVSHNVALIRPIADFVVALGSDGRIASQGSLEKTLQEDVQLQSELTSEEEQLKSAEEIIDKLDPEAKDVQTGKLIVAEEIKEGHVGWDTLRIFAVNISSRPTLYWAGYLTMLAATHSFMNSQSYLLGLWAAQYEKHDPSEVPVSFYLPLYLGSVVLTILAYAVAWLFYITGSTRASRIIHSQLVATILGTTLRWLDMTPTSRIIARCTADMHEVDVSLPKYVLLVVETAVFMTLRVVAVALVAPLFVIPALIIGVAGGLLGRIYMKAQICVKREMSNTRAPVLGHFGSAISGLVSIRAYGAQRRFKDESYVRVDRYSRAALIYNALNRWITVRVDVMGTLLSVILAAYLVYFSSSSASNAGFALTMAAGFSATILQWVRLFNYLQISANSLERVQQYLTIEQEEKPTANGIPPAYWPASGDLRVEKLSARYSADGPRVLHEISFEVKSGERIGIVGRTGSGKSSLTLALLRCIMTEGKVYYDGLPTDTINLDALRSNITIIPQTPELLSGTLRKNLDPLEQHDDSTLNDALRSAGLFSLQESEDSARLTLDSEIAGGGSNLSVGQRQIIALARAIVRRSKLLILDEATSAIDYATDNIIQKSLREELGRDVTVLTVAHRLQSIMDADRIMVLDAGRIVEYDAPQTLLAKSEGYFRSLVEGSGDKAALYAQAGYVESA
ncbi:multidrug resistance-associated ABC transporter [Trametes polyzona]|nr:multidrug resistance-associated ABC transporter [Trametes polyzona]